jgi:hypothetical protein
MKAIVKKSFVHSQTKIHYQVGQIFENTKEEIERINNILVHGLEIVQANEVLQPKEPIQLKKRGRIKK